MVVPPPTSAFSIAMVKKQEAFKPNKSGTSSDVTFQK